MNAVYHTLEQKLERLKEQIIKLEQIKKEVKSVSDLEKDSFKEAAVERLFQVALEAVLDIGRMIISLENLTRPQTNDEVFKILNKAKILPSDFAQQAIGMGTFRNILVHGYMIIEEKKVFENLQKLDLLKTFSKFITVYLKKQAV